MPIRRVRCGRCQAKSADNTGCCKGERRQWRKQRTEAGAAVAECEGLLPPKHDAGTATRHYRAFWQRRCRAAAAGAVLKPQGGNCAVLPFLFLCFPQRGRIFRRSVPAFSRICESFFVFSISASCSRKSHTLSRQSVFGINTLDFI